jgi:hypothetical protein
MSCGLAWSSTDERQLLPFVLPLRTLWLSRGVTNLVRRRIWLVVLCTRVVWRETLREVWSVGYSEGEVKHLEGEVLAWNGKKLDGWCLA